MDNIKEKIRDSIRDFIRNDKDFLMHVKIHEITLSHRIAVYLEKYFNNTGYVVDCEYNKIIDNPKINIEGVKIRPDIIIHKRNSYDNVAIFEIKKAGKDSLKGKADIEKLKKCKNLNYKIGVFVGILKRKIDIAWIERGRIIEFEIIKT